MTIDHATHRRPVEAMGPMRGERPRPSDPGADEDVPDEREIESGRENNRPTPGESQRETAGGA
jgi:hypothetical protein